MSSQYKRNFHIHKLHSQSKRNAHFDLLQSISNRFLHTDVHTNSNIMQQQGYIQHLRFRSPTELTMLKFSTQTPRRLNSNPNKLYKHTVHILPVIHTIPFFRYNK